MYKNSLKVLFLTITLTFIFTSVVLAEAEGAVKPEEYVNKDTLQETIEEAKTISNPKRGAELAEALNNAIDIFNNESASQEEVDEVESTLRDEISFSEIISVKVDDLITIEHKGGYDKVEAQNMVDRLYKIAPFMRDGLVEAGVEVKLIDFRLTDMPEWVHLRGEVPRGWDEDGPTWDDVPGAGGNPMVTRIGYSEPSKENGHSAINLELHEIAHVIDKHVFNHVSVNSEEFLQIHEEEAPLFLNDDYHVTYSEEYFAQSFGYYFKNEETKSELKEKAPKTYKFIENLVIVVDKDTLQATIEEAKNISNPKREAELAEALSNAIDVSNNESASQKEVDEAESKLRDEISFSEIISVKVDDLITIEHKGGYDKVEAQNIVNRLYKIAPFMRNKLVEAGVEVKLIDFPLTDMPEWVHLRGEVPRGWDEDGPTWDDVPGAGGNPMVTRIGYSEPSKENGHSAINLELHEIAHVIDKYVFDHVSVNSEEFLQIHEEEAPLFLNDDYHVTYSEEYFAQSFGYYFKNEETKSELKEKAPKTYEFINNLVMPVVKDELAEAIDEAQKIEGDLKEALENALQVYNNPNATQEEIDAMTKKLLSLIKELENETIEQENNDSIEDKDDLNEEKDNGFGSVNNNQLEEDKSDYVSSNDIEKVKTEKGSTLPDTATNIYSYLLVGGILLIVGMAVLLLGRKKLFSNQ